MPMFRRKPETVEAVQLTTPLRIEMEGRRVRGEPGDWLVTGSNGNQFIVSKDDMDRLYEPADAPRLGAA